jgi:uncharacterized protein YjbI with pentapeptide repeats
MIGLQFEACSDFGFSLEFSNCILNHSSFYQKKIKNTLFFDSKLLEVEFTESDLTQTVFDMCDLTRSIFENSNLEKTDFRTAINYSIDLDKNKVKKALFSLNGTPGLLGKYGIKIS